MAQSSVDMKAFNVRCKIGEFGINKTTAADDTEPDNGGGGVKVKILIRFSIS